MAELPSLARGLEQSLVSSPYIQETQSMLHNVIATRQQRARIDVRDKRKDTRGKGVGTESIGPAVIRSKSSHVNIFEARADNNSRRQHTLKKRNSRQCHSQTDHKKGSLSLAYGTSTLPALRFTESTVSALTRSRHKSPSRSSDSLRLLEPIITLYSNGAAPKLHGRSRESSSCPNINSTDHNKLSHAHITWDESVRISTASSTRDASDSENFRQSDPARIRAEQARQNVVRRRFDFANTTLQSKRKQRRGIQEVTSNSCRDPGIVGTEKKREYRADHSDLSVDTDEQDTDIAAIEAIRTKYNETHLQYMADVLSSSPEDMSDALWSAPQ